MDEIHNVIRYVDRTGGSLFTCFTYYSLSSIESELGLNKLKQRAIMSINSTYVVSASELVYCMSAVSVKRA